MTRRGTIENLNTKSCNLFGETILEKHYSIKSGHFTDNMCFRSSIYN